MALNDGFRAGEISCFGMELRDILKMLSLTFDSINHIWPHWPEVGQSEARCFFGYQAFGPSSVSFPGHHQGAGM